MLYLFLSNSDFRGARTSEFWSDSFIEQNKNNIVFAFFLTLVYLNIFEEVNWRFVAYEYNKFNVDIMFGMNRTALHSATCTTMKELTGQINKMRGV